MTSIQWTNENSIRDYPLLAGSLPKDFIVDASISTQGTTDCRITTASYDSGTDLWTLGISAGTESLTIVSPRTLPEGVVESSDADNDLYVFLTAGRSWTDTSWYSGPLSPNQSFDRSVITAGTHGLIDLYPIPQEGGLIDSPGGLAYTDPDGVLYAQPYSSSPWDKITLRAGYNITFDGSKSNRLNISALPGAGDGQVPCWDTALRTLTGVGPDANGRLWLTSKGCLEISQCPVGSEGMDTPNDLWVLGDGCRPCCSDEDYSRLSKGVSRMSAKLAEINDQLLMSGVCMQDNYCAGINLIRESQRSMFIVHTVMVFPTYLKLTIQNLSTSPGYAVFGIDSRHTESSAPSLSLASICNSWVKSGVTVGVGCPPEWNPSTRFDTGTTNYEIYTVGSEDSSSTLLPLKSGESASVYLLAADSVAVFDCCLQRQERLAFFLNGSDLTAGLDGTYDTMAASLATAPNRIVETACRNGTDQSCPADEACKHQMDKLLVVEQDLKTLMWAKKIRYVLGASGCFGFNALYDNTNPSDPLNAALTELEGSASILTEFNFPCPSIATAWAQYAMHVETGHIPGVTEAAIEAPCDFTGYIGTPYGFNYSYVRADWREALTKMTTLMASIYTMTVAAIELEEDRMRALLLDYMILNVLPNPIEFKCSGIVVGGCFDCGTQVYSHRLPEADTTPAGYTGSTYGPLSSILSLYQESRQPL